MQIIIFIVLSTLYFFLGVKFLKNKNIQSFLLLTIILPLTPSLTSLHTRFQVSVYYFFVFVAVIFFFCFALLKSKIDRNVAIVTIVIVGFICFYLAYDFLLHRENLELINLLKDLKPLFFLLFGFSFIKILSNIQLDWNGAVAKKIMKYNCIASLFWFIILNNTSLIGGVSNDSFYLSSETRYSAVGTVFVMLYFIAGLANKRKFDKYDLAYILIPLFLSGNRTVLFSLGIIYLVNMLLAIKNVITLIKRIGLFIISGLVLIFGIFSFNEKLRERILTMVDYEIVLMQLKEYRFAPFIDKLVTYNWYDYIFGKGLGETVFIPWFVWRKNIENYNIYMDNIYLTLYIKYGIFAFVIFLLLYYFIKQTNTNRRFRVLVIVYLAIMGLTTAFMYQVPFLFMLIVLASFGFVKSKKLVKE